MMLNDADTIVSRNYSGFLRIIIVSNDNLKGMQNSIFYVCSTLGFQLLTLLHAKKASLTVYGTEIILSTFCQYL